MLTDTAIRKATPGERDYKLADAGGLFLLVTKAEANCGDGSTDLRGRKRK